MNKIDYLIEKRKIIPQKELAFLSRATNEQAERYVNNKLGYDFVRLDALDKQGKIDVYNPPDIWGITFQRWLLRKYGAVWLVKYLKERDYAGKHEGIPGRLQAIGLTAEEIDLALEDKEIISFFVAGVTFENRQKALERLTYYAPEEILTVLVEEPDNPYDKNAIAVKVFVKGTDRSYCLGYVPKADIPRIKSGLTNSHELKITYEKNNYKAQVSTKMTIKA